MITSNYNPLTARAATAAYGSRASATVSASAQYLEIMGGTGGTNGAKGTAGAPCSAQDTADVSSTARELLDRVKNLDVFSAIYPNNDATKKTKTLGEVKNDFLGDFNDFSSYFGTMSQMMGLDSTDTFTMGLNGTGGMTVSGTDANAAAKLQEGFSGNRTMTARFAVMAARAALADAGATEPGFAGAYAEDPVAAIENNIGALKERLLGFRTVAGGGEMQYGFMRNKEIEYAAETEKYEAA